MPELTRQAAGTGGERSAAKPQRRKFLPEVQALRALAVLLVVIYHLQPGWLPGGFVGVDVFFVISGFLITGHMLREVQRTGRLSLAAFWAARARRILPAALVTIAAVCLATFLLSPATQWGRIGSQALASTFYTQNWVLAADSTDYMAAGNSATPLQHF
ncbi:MAG TPA: acyltransferase, partial [Arthrobacter sp.]|nr:acyltransferase [Arthrobacter sp.]